MKNLMEFARKEIALVESLSDNDSDIILNICNKIDKYPYIKDVLLKLFQGKYLSPIDLSPDNFDTYGKHIRCSHIVMGNDTIYYSNAFKLKIIHTYIHNDKQEVAVTKWTDIASTIYITKGGVVTGEFFTNACELLPSAIRTGKFTIHEPVVIPCSVIDNGDYFIYTVDSREPKLKALKEFYKVSICFNEDIKGKYDIRKYEKLNKD
jgi:hypothetical protein